MGAVKHEVFFVRPHRERRAERAVRWWVWWVVVEWWWRWWGGEQVEVGERAQPHKDVVLAVDQSEPHVLAD